jgi:integrase
MNRKIRVSDKSLTPEQCAKVLASAEGEMKGLVLVAMTTGQRIGDVIALKRGDLDLTINTIRFRIAKTGRALQVPLDPRVRAWFEEQPESTIPVEFDTALFPRLAARGRDRTATDLRKLGAKVGVLMSAVSFRHTLARELITKGTPLAVIQELLGYRCPK